MLGRDDFTIRQRPLESPRNSSHTPFPQQQNIRNTTMAPKKNAAASPSPAAMPPSAAKPTAAVTSASGTPTKAANKPSTKDIRNAQDMQEIAVGMWNNYVDKTPQRVKLLDAFLVFLMTVGMWQFVYCVIAGNFVSLDILFFFFLLE